ncbi:MAG TPA: hypothetical protein VFQ53_18795 [Kofleriaceae bacterium]|nr:hypothetical protein [Kofleriaceae bacterium]
MKFELSDRHAGLMRSLIDVVQLERDPLDGVDRVLATVHTGTDGTLEEYRAAIDQALASNVRLTRLVPEYHPEDILRRFLVEVRRRLSVIN